MVNFIVRAVDDILKTEFGLRDGLADTSKTKIKVQLQETDKRYKDNIKTVEEEVHRVQILDPATGTGTFLAEVVKQIHEKYKSMQGAWSSYVDNHLLPRLNGFELLMASYAMAHLQLDLLLTETGYKSTKDQRFRVYLTNSLEEYHKDTGTLFANWLSTEANEANRIKRDTPVMCVMGNPPYSGESSNKGEWIVKLMEDYKKEPGGVEKLKEKNSKWINADENKFIRYGQHFIEKNGSGVLAFINPHGFLDNPTLRGMRWNLLKTFDKIFIIDLHGNSNKGKSDDGIVDQNVFDIMQGVSINIFVKTGKKKEQELAKVFLTSLYGKREYKYTSLLSNSIEKTAFKLIDILPPHFAFKEQDIQLGGQYRLGFSLNELFALNGNGIVTKRDELCIQDTPELSLASASDILNLSKQEFYSKYRLPDDVRDWRYEWAQEDIKKSNLTKDSVQQINYRPFDTKYIFYTGRSRGFVGWPVDKIMSNYIGKDNIGILCPKSLRDADFAHVFITNQISEAIFLSSKTGSNAMNFPLYVYNKKIHQTSLESNSNRTPNLNTETVSRIAQGLDHCFVWEKGQDYPITDKPQLAPIDILDYIYAVLHSPTYREKYKEFLKIDFPRVPYPKNADTFWSLVKLGGELREIHLLESPVLDKFITQYPIDGNNTIGKLKYEDGKVYINQTQYFANVPEVAWNFYIGGYQPAQKWLKDRKDRQLSFEDILHYQKVIVALIETDRMMKEIDKFTID